MFILMYLGYYLMYIMYLVQWVTVRIAATFKYSKWLDTQLGSGESDLFCL